MKEFLKANLKPKGMARMESLTQSRFIKYKERLKEKTNFLAILTKIK